MELIGSTKTFTPCTSKVMSPGRASLSRSRLYWNPEHPPPTTATRKPDPARFSRSMVSLTMAAALSVSLMGGGGSDWLVVCGFCVWVSIVLPFGWLGVQYNRSTLDARVQSPLFAGSRLRTHTSEKPFAAGQLKELVHP